MMISICVNVAASGIVSFLFMGEWCSALYIYHFFIDSSVNGHLGCFHVLSIVTSAAVNIEGLVTFNHSFV